MKCPSSGDHDDAPATTHKSASARCVELAQYSERVSLLLFNGVTYTVPAHTMVSLSTLPPELLQAVVSVLSNRDIKNLRLTGRYFGRVARLRLNRIFLSPHPFDIKVLYHVAQHEAYREHVTELIYDDARFDEPKDEISEYFDGVPRWFKREFHANCEELENRKGNLVERPDHVQTAKQYNARLSLKQCYARYQKVTEEQDQVIAAGSDITALRYGLERFPNLQRVILTPVAHGVPFRPFYETPMIRDLPYGFIYPIPRPWPASESDCGAEHTYPPWEDEEKNHWRGLRVVLDTLAQHLHRITEFVVEVNQLNTGLSCRMFEKRSENQEYENFLSLLRTPGFSRLDLSISAGAQDDGHWPCFRSGLLRYALSEAKDIQRISLSTAMAIPKSVHKPWKYHGGGKEHHFPLRTIFPLDQWPNLRHFGLSHFIVKRQDLIDFLSAMPSTLRSVELSFLEFLETSKDHYRETIRDIRDKVHWRERPVLERPRITIYLESDPPGQGYCVDISQEAEDFVYRNGDNPFGEDDGRRVRGDRVYRSSGRGIERDMFNPLNDLPFVDDEQLMDMGILEPSD